MAASRTVYEAQRELHAGAWCLTATATRMRAVVLKRNPQPPALHVPGPPCTHQHVPPRQRHGQRLRLDGGGLVVPAVQGHACRTGARTRVKPAAAPATGQGARDGSGARAQVQMHVQVGLGLEFTGSGSDAPSGR